MFLSRQLYSREAEVHHREWVVSIFHRGPEGRIPIQLELASEHLDGEP